MIIGLDVLGNRSTVLGVETARVVTIDVDPVATAKSQGGVAALAAGVLPGVTSDEVYKRLVSEFQDALKAKNIPADVRVVYKNTLGAEASAVDLRTLGVGVGVGIGGTLLVKWLLGLLFGGRQ